MAWASGPWSCPNHAAFLSKKDQLQKQNLFLQMAPTNDAQKISRLDASDFNDFEGLKKENKELKETGVGWSQILQW